MQEGSRQILDFRRQVSESRIEKATGWLQNVESILDYIVA